MPLASVIVLAYGNRAVTERCLDSLAVALGDELGGAYELVLVDNNSPDDTAELFHAWEDRATVVLNPENLNFAGGCNAGARAATGDVLLFLNNDTEVPPGAIEAIVATAQEPGVGAVGTRLLYPDGTIQHAGVVHRGGGEAGALPFHLFHHEPGDTPAARAIYELDAVTGACLAVPAAVFRDLGGFDEDYVNGVEDVDLCLRARMAGLRAVYRGDVHVVHHERATRGTRHDEGDNIATFRRRWAKLVADDGDTLRGLFDLSFAPPPPGAGLLPQPVGASLAVHGRLRSGTPDGFEVRALIAALAGTGLDVAAGEWAPVWEAPSDGGPHWQALARAMQRPPHPDAAAIRVAGGPLCSFPAGSAAVARLASVPRGALDVAAVWAASPALAGDLADRGVPRECIEWLPPAIPEALPGPGGQGVLAFLPAHDMESAGVLLDALSAFSAQRVRLLPNVKSPLLAKLVAERLPAAELLDPTSNEGVVSQLAALSDVVCGSDGDTFERRLLLAGSAGAAVVATAGGPAAAVLGDGVPLGVDAGSLRRALENAFSDAAVRVERSQRVASACGPAAMGERLRDLAERLEAIRRVPVVGAVAPALA